MIEHEQLTLQQRAPTGNGASAVRRFCRLIHLSALAMLTSCASTEPFPNLPRMSVSTQFDVENLCDMAVSPAIRLVKVPDKVAKYIVQISNVNVLIQTPWREVIPASSKTEIPEGAAKTYVGPCFGDMARFDPISPYGYQHRVEVLAENSDGEPLAYGSTVVWVQSPYLTAKQERLHLQRPSGPPPATQGQFGVPGQYGSSGTNFPGGAGLMNSGGY